MNSCPPHAARWPAPSAPTGPRAPWSWATWARRAGAIVLVLAGTGCATLVPELPPAVDTACHAWEAQLDAAVQRAGVADAEAARIPGLAGLRVDRVAEALRTPASAEAGAFDAWLQRAAALDAAAREAEVANLPAAALPSLGAGSDEAARQAALSRSAACRQQLLRQLSSATPEQRAALLAAARVPDRYSLALRTLGLYPVARWPFFAGVQRWQQDHEATMARWALQPPALQRHVPAGAHTALPPRTPWATDALGLPQPTAEEARQLLAWHAPVFEIEQLGPYDHFGSPHWGADGTPRVDSGQPVVYQRLAHTRWGGRWHLQLVYTLWFPERPARSAFDILAGALDGVVVRITLDEHGRALLVDSIHACGCYHLFFPSPAVRPRKGAPRAQEWLFAPAPLPPLQASDRLVVRISSATHDVLGLLATPRETATGRPYALVAEDALRSRPAPGGRRSLYGPDGLVAGTARGERFLFWPMGIASAGAMRQWGHHATAFVGRRHFDDVDLLERRFHPPAPRPGPAPAGAPGRPD